MKSRSPKLKSGRSSSRNGFTLLEVIATILLSSVLVALMLPLIGAGLEGNRRPLLRMPATYSLRTEMDAWWQQYRAVYPSDLSGLQTAIADADSPSYTVLYNGWVDFDAAGVEFIPAPGTENVLRVTLGNSQGERLTTYFFPIP